MFEYEDDLKDRVAELEKKSAEDDIIIESLQEMLRFEFMKTEQAEQRASRLRYALLEVATTTKSHALQSAVFPIQKIVELALAADSPDRGST